MKALLSLCLTVAAVACSGADDALHVDLRLPEISQGPPGPGRRVAVTAPEYAGTDVHHMLYLPRDWSEKAVAGGRIWPVIAEYTGNYFPAAGSTGKVEDAGLGFGISGGRFIWVTLPFVSADRKQNAVTWWGNEAATMEYAKRNLSRTCQQFGGNPRAVFLCGFSRGAIATNYIGLHDDTIARLWCGFITHDHYDGVREWKGTTWGSPLVAYRAAAAERLKRIDGRPVLICQNGGTHQVADYLRPRVPLDNFTFLDVNTTRILGAFPNEVAIHPHNDRWLLKDSPERRRVRQWLHGVLKVATSSDASEACDEYISN